MDGEAVPPAAQLREFGARVGVTVLVAVAVAAALPAMLFTAAMSAFLFYAAVGMALMALWRSEELAQPGRLNRWDSAVLLMLLSLAFGLMVDEEAVSGYLEERFDAVADPDR
jgi:amino acid transporter